MATDPLTRVLELVAEGRLSADEAAPILAALDGSQAAEPSTRTSGSGAGDTTAGAAGETSTGRPEAGPSAIRIEIREAGREVVNLRLPIAVGRLALDRVPGLSGNQVERVREALRTGVRGPILLIEDGGDVVRIVLE